MTSVSNNNSQSSNPPATAPAKEKAKSSSFLGIPLPSLFNPAPQPIDATKKEIQKDLDKSKKQVAQAHDNCLQKFANRTKIANALQDAENKLERLTEIKDSIDHIISTRRNTNLSKQLSAAQKQVETQEKVVKELLDQVFQVEAEFNQAEEELNNAKTELEQAQACLKRIEKAASGLTSPSDLDDDSSSIGDEDHTSELLDDKKNTLGNSPLFDQHSLNSQSGTILDALLTPTTTPAPTATAPGIVIPGSGPITTANVIAHITQGSGEPTIFVDATIICLDETELAALRRDGNARKIEQFTYRVQAHIPVPKGTTADCKQLYTDSLANIFRMITVDAEAKKAGIEIGKTRNFSLAIFNHGIAVENTSTQTSGWLQDPNAQTYAEGLSKGDVEKLNGLTAGTKPYQSTLHSQAGGPISSNPSHTKPSITPTLSPAPLPNVGNTCPYASTLQILAANPDLKRMVTTANPKLGQLLSSYETYQKEYKTNPSVKLGFDLGDKFDEILKDLGTEVPTDPKTGTRGFQDAREILSKILGQVEELKTTQILANGDKPEGLPLLTVGIPTVETIHINDHLTSRPDVFQAAPDHLFLTTSKNPTKQGKLQFTLGDPIRLSKEHFEGAPKEESYELTSYFVNTSNHYISYVKVVDETGKTKYVKCDDGKITPLKEEKEFFEKASEANFYCLKKINPAVGSGQPAPTSASPALYQAPTRDILVDKRHVGGDSESFLTIEKGDIYSQKGHTAILPPVQVNDSPILNTATTIRHAKKQPVISLTASSRIKKQILSVLEEEVAKGQTNFVIPIHQNNYEATRNAILECAKEIKGINVKIILNPEQAADASLIRTILKISKQELFEVKDTENAKDISARLGTALNSLSDQERLVIAVPANTAKRKAILDKIKHLKMEQKVTLISDTRSVEYRLSDLTPQERSQTKMLFEGISNPFPSTAPRIDHTTKQEIKAVVDTDHALWTQTINDQLNAQTGNSNICFKAPNHPFRDEVLSVFLDTLKTSSRKFPKVTVIV